MKTKVKVVTPAPTRKTTGRQMNLTTSSYQKPSTSSTQKHLDMITRRRNQIPRLHRANYDKAMSGKSMKAAIKAHCLECMHWQKKEVSHCTSYGCALYPYRPYKTAKEASEAISSEQELPYSINRGGRKG